ncbi:hypothetical protein N7478_011006 [Penicillium angulare]|uniref:uncharacterized protein n=1 Tax=Penicillium angulare TaxID=116970 RepID=UPI002541FD47|nr:uncharacterized protein N7478_011006 [Penicillium angulare]KAJ5263401.1 hypothetical protein N7478_011006 [Penicillium angulare]
MSAILDDSPPHAAPDDAPTSWETRAGSNMPLHDIMEQWSKYEVEETNDDAWGQPNENLDEGDDDPSDDAESFNMNPIEETDTDETLSTTMPALVKYREFIVGNPAYDWFLKDIHKHSHLVPSSPDISAEIRKTILQALPSQTTFSRREPVNLYKMTYSMDWDLISFLKEQEYNEENYRALPLVITLTGSREAAQALTCSQYLHQTWPSSAGEVLKTLQTVLQKSKAAGTKDTKYDLAGSRLPKPRNNRIYSQTFITSGQIVTGCSPFLVGYKDTPFHVSRARYIRKLKWIIQKLVVLWDEETKQGWLLNGASALSHLILASIVQDTTDPLISECLFQWDKLEEGPSNSAHIPGSAIALLLNHNNRALAIYNSKDKHIKFENRAEHFLNILEQIFDYKVYTVGPDGDGYTSKSIPRAHFEGWDFHDLATESDPLYPRLAKMASKGKAWIDFTRSIHAINLLGRGFGEILEPLNSSCSHWASLPKDQYYLAAGIADLQNIVEYTGDLTANPIRLSEDLVWHNPEHIFDFCGCVDATANHADVVQRSCLGLFGSSRDFQWRWGDSGDPERDDIQADEQEYLSSTYDLGPDNSNTSSIGSKSDLARLSSIEAPSTEDTIPTSCAEDEGTQPKPLARSYTHWNLASLRAEDYAVGIVCALPLELLAVRALFDQTHPTIELSAAHSNHYALGSMGRHRVVAACLPDGEYGTNSAADVASNLRRSFPSVKFCLLVGIGGGVPSPTNDIRLGDVVVSKPIGMNPGVIQYDMGKALRSGVFEQNGVLYAPPHMIMTALSSLKSDPHLPENPLQEYIDEIAAWRKESNVLCFDMEAAGIMNTLPCLVIRGICDYSDSHKNKVFQEYAAATAASYAKLLLSYIKYTNEMDGMASRSIKDDQSLLGAFRRALTFLPMRGA